MRPASLLTVLLILSLVGCAVHVSPTASPWGDLPPDRKWVA